MLDDEKREIEEKRDKLNQDIRTLLIVIDQIYGETKEYENYIMNSLDEKGFLDQQQKLITEGKEKLMSIFKE